MPVLVPPDSRSGLAHGVAGELEAGVAVALSDLEKDGKMKGIKF